MKKLKILTLTILMILLVLPFSAIAVDDTEYCKCTMQVVFKEPVELPEDFGLMYFGDIEDASSSTINCMTYTQEFYPGTALTERDIPHIYTPKVFQVESAGWDTEPEVGMVINEDCTFTYTIDNTGTVPVTFRAIRNADALSEEQPLRYYAPWNLSSYVILVKPGYVIAEADLPDKFVGTDVGTIGPAYEDAGWSEDPVGYTVNEAHEFKHHFNRFFCLDFIYPTATVVPHTILVEPGGDAVPPEVPDKHEDKYFCYWDGEYTNVTSSGRITAIYREMGDVNMDKTVNTADAVTLLKHVAELEEIEEVAVRLADISDDGKINTADAVAVLKKCAE